MGLGRLLLAALSLGAATIASAQDGLTVRVDSGSLKGVADGSVIVFKGIPYAAPPVGDLRWRPPVAAAAWPGVRDAARYGAACPQPSDHKEPWARVGPRSEDCLFLNIWRPKASGKYPVMVFLHGGGFTYGAAGVPLYDGANFARRGVVIVTLNYRLGLLGFFAHPALTRESPNGRLGNYGIMDQIAALKWVKRNIAVFGGDASNVTVFGESAGAGVVQVLMSSPDAKGLFQKAISESGAGGSVLMPIRGGAKSAEALGDLLATSAGMPGATAAQLRALPADKLARRSFPFIDGTVVVASPGAPFARAGEAQVPFIVGANSNEATLTGNNETMARVALGDDYEAALRDYAAGAGKAAPVELAEDALSILPSFSLARMHAANGALAYAFYFDQVPSNLRTGAAGAPHGGEIEYLFGNPDDGSTWDDTDRAVSDRMAGYWVRFARTGDPNGPGAPRWPAVGGAGPLGYLVIGTPTHGDTLSPLREKVRERSLATSKAGWTDTAKD